MNLLDFYFDTKVGLHNPSKTFELLSTITCWIFNVVGCIGAVASFIGIIVALSINVPGFGFILGVVLGCLCAIVILALFKFLGWLSAFGFQCRAITLAAHEKILNTNFNAIPAAASAPAAKTPPQPVPAVIPLAASAKAETPEETPPIVPSPAKSGKASYMDFWTCRHCGTSNNGLMSSCVRCKKAQDE